MEDGYSGSWHQVNPELSRIELPDGWIVLTRTHIVVGGKDLWVVNNSWFYRDPQKKWRLKTK